MHQITKAAVAATLAAVSMQAHAQTADDAQNADIIVTGERLASPEKTFEGGQVARGARVGILGNRSIFDTPFSQTAYTEQLLRDQQARTIADIVENDPSVRNISASGAPQHDFFIRGFRADSDDIAFNGTFGIAPQNRTTIEGIERVEILRGPTALINGVPPLGGIGGTINLAPKRATDAPITRGEARFASQSQFGGHIDLGRRFGPDNAFGVRVNAAYRDGELGVRDNAVALGVLAVALDYSRGPLRLSVDLGYHEEDIDGINADRSVSAGVAIPRAPSNRTNLNQPWEFQDSTHKFALGRIELDVVKGVTLTAAYGRSEFTALNLGGGAEITGADGSYSQGIFLVPLDLDRETYEFGARADFKTGAISHNLVVAASNVQGTTGFNFSFVDFVDGLNIYRPAKRGAPSIDGLPTNAITAFGFRNRGVSVADVITAYDGRVSLTLGGRYQQLRSVSFDFGGTGARTVDYDKGRFSPAVALLFKPIERLSLYANYAEGLQPGQVVQPPAANAGQVFAPFVSKQYEVGAKYDFGGFGASIAAFQITQPSSFDRPRPNGQFETLVDGEQRNRGIELNLFGELARGFRVLGGFALLEGKLTRTGDIDGNGATGDEDGNRAPGVPKLQLNLYAEHDLGFAPGLTVTGRVVHTSRQFYDRGEQQSIPSWTRFDVGARYTVSLAETPVTLRATVTNVGGRHYYQSAANGSLTQGEPRTVLLSAGVAF